MNYISVLTILVISVVTLLAPNSLASEEIKVAYFKWSPLIDIHEGEINPTGSAVDYYETEVAEKLGVTIKWMGPFSIDRAIKLVQTNKVDMIPFLTKNAERSKILAYPENPFYIMKPVVCLQKGIEIDKLESWDDLQDVAPRVGIFYQTAFQKKMSKKYPNLNLRKIGGKEDIVGYAMTLLAEKQAGCLHSFRSTNDG